MRIKLWFFLAGFGMAVHAWAVNTHLHPHSEQADPVSQNQVMSYPGSCDIELINNSFNDVHVHGVFDDGATLDFNIYRFESSHYISLFYNHYCHRGMYLEIYSPYSRVYSGWTNVRSLIRLVPYLNTQAKANVSIR